MCVLFRIVLFIVIIALYVAGFIRFLAVSVETFLVHWAHGIKDTRALDVVRYYLVLPM